MGVARRQLDRFGQQQSLRGRGAGFFQAAQHLLEQNPLMGGVLVQQHQAAIRFEHDVEAAHHAHQPQRNLQKRDGGGGRGGLRAPADWRARRRGRRMQM